MELKKNWIWVQKEMKNERKSCRDKIIVAQLIDCWGKLNNIKMISVKCLLRTINSPGYWGIQCIFCHSFCFYSVENEFGIFYEDFFFVKDLTL